jgi:hypothetical protein
MSDAAFSSNDKTTRCNDLTYSETNNYVKKKHVTLNYAKTKTDSTTTFLDESAKLWKATISSAMSVRLSSWNNSAPNGRIFIKYETCGENLSYIKIGKE